MSGPGSCEAGHPPHADEFDKPTRKKDELPCGGCVPGGIRRLRADHEAHHHNRDHSDRRRRRPHPRPCRLDPLPDAHRFPRVLRRFTAFADREGKDYITVDLFLRWKAAYGNADNNTWSARLGMVRVFAHWLQAHDGRTEVPPAGLIAGPPGPRLA